MLRHVIECIEDRNIFLRRRKSNDIRALAVLLCYAGPSYRRARDILLGYGKVSHEAIRKWYVKCRSVTEVERRKRRTVAIDETKLKVDGKHIYLWAAIDVDTREILAVHVSSARCHLDTYISLRKVLKKCRNKPFVIVDRGPWYPWAIIQT